MIDDAHYAARRAGDRVQPPPHRGPTSDGAKTDALDARRAAREVLGRR